MNSHITSIGTAVPAHKISQKQVHNFMSRVNGLDEKETHELELLYRASGITNRYTVLEDYGKLNEFEFFPNNKNLEPFPNTSQRIDRFRKEALDLSEKSINACLKDSPIKINEITHLITVSCTGMYAPGLDIDLIYKLGLNKSIERLSINFMGCYAAFNAIKMADAICSSSKAKVLIVCTELCTLHFQKGKEPDNLLANSLFGDGSASLLVESETRAKQYLSTSEFNCDLLPNGEQDMAWQIGAFGFEMKLSTYIPDIIETGIHQLLSTYKPSFDYYAIHPGGKKILSVVEKSLNISKLKNLWAHDVLRRYGNMSSPTVLFVLKEIFDQLKIEDNDKDLLSIAFGPGLTLESMVLKIKVD
jgi:alpha-pyrone synthase